jgi:16S rRNA processing protein RimM
MEELVAIAKLARTRGLRGELVADVLTDFPERFEATKDVFVLSPSGEIRELKIEKYWFQKNRVVLKFEGFDTIESAETLVDSEVCVPEADVVDLDEDEYFDWELIDCQVKTVIGEPLGRVKQILRTSGTEVLVVESSGAKKDFLIPFAEAICTDVDIENKLILVDPPEGLLDF